MQPQPAPRGAPFPPRGFVPPSRGAIPSAPPPRGPPASLSAARGPQQAFAGLPAAQGFAGATLGSQGLGGAPGPQGFGGGPSQPGMQGFGGPQQAQGRFGGPRQVPGGFGGPQQPPGGFGGPQQVGGGSAGQQQPLGGFGGPQQAPGGGGFGGPQHALGGFGGQPGGFGGPQQAAPGGFGGLAGGQAGSAPRGAPRSGFVAPPSSGAQIPRGVMSGAAMPPTQLGSGIASVRGVKVDLSPHLQCPSAYSRMTFERFPESESVRAKAGNMLLGAIYRPFNDSEGVQPVPTVNFGSHGVIRCRRCRSYVGPHSVFIDNGKRWQCSLCWNTNECEPEYYCPFDPSTGKRQDQMSRPELSSGIIDIIAPDEYTLRPPPPPVFLFVIDVSRDAVLSGLVHAASAAIRRCLARLPGAPRTQIGFITFDSDIHFYDLSGGPEGTGGPRMLVVSDVGQLFMPASVDDLLVDLKFRKEAVETLLDQLPTMHSGLNQESMLGPALEAAYEIIAPLGGKVSVFQSQLPSLMDPALGTPGQANQPSKDATDATHGGLAKPGRGADGRALGGPKESEFLQPGSLWYSRRAESFVRQHICVDWYACSAQYADLATVGELCHLTSGRLRYYPKFHAHRDGERLSRDIERSLTTVCAAEAVMRVRASTGVKVSRFYGSFAMRARDLLSLPESDTDSAYGFEFSFEDDVLTGGFVTFQAAVLYTSLEGERRIRVTNQAVPVTNNHLEVMQGMQVDVESALWLKRAVEEARESSGGLDLARNQLKLAFWKMVEVNGFVQNCPQLAETLALNVVGGIKSTALRGGTDIGFDERYYLLRLIGRASVERLARVMQPKLWMLNMQGGQAKELAPTKNSLTSDGVYFLDNGLHLMIWLGSQSSSLWGQILFGVDDASRIDPGLLRISPPAPTGEHPLKTQIWTLIHQIRKHRMEDYAQIIVAREGDGAVEARFFWSLILDHHTFRGGEVTVEELLSRGAQTGAGRPPGGVPQTGMPPMGGGGARPPPQQTQSQMQQMQQHGSGYAGIPPRGPQTPMPAGAPPRGGMAPPQGGMIAPLQGGMIPPQHVAAASPRGPPGPPPSMGMAPPQQGRPAPPPGTMPPRGPPQGQHPAPSYGGQPPPSYGGGQQPRGPPGGGGPPPQQGGPRPMMAGAGPPRSGMQQPQQPMQR